MTRPRRDLSETEIRERVRKLRGDLEIHRLPSPERLKLLEQLVIVQDELLLHMAEKAMQSG